MYPPSLSQSPTRSDTRLLTDARVDDGLRGRTLRVEGLSRRFGAVRALDGVSLALQAGEVHALMGENGAGKSTLIRILAGLDRPDQGEIQRDGVALPLGQPATMRAAGLRFIHQELHAVPGLSVAENMLLDHPYPRRFGLVDWAALNNSAASALARLGLDHLDPRRAMSELGTGDRMLVRIAASLIGGGAWLYVMDEPTAALTSAEADRLFGVIGDLVLQGAAILYVSHRMGEVMRLADRITVLRDGLHISTRPKAETDTARVIADMTGRDLGGLFPPKTKTPRETKVLKSEAMSAPGLVRADFELHAGEVLGLAGLAGSGRGALLRAVLGAGPRAGRLTLDGAAVGQSPAEAWAQGIAYVPRERRAEGLIIGRPIFENVTLPHLQCFARAGVFVDTAHEKRRSHNLGKHVRLKATGIMQVCAELSGGNQQKVLFARALAGKPRVLLLDEPTRGVDIGARFDIYRLIQNLRDEGVSILLASSDLPELLGVSDRIGVMRDGILTEILKADNLSEGSLLARFYHRQEAQT